MPLDFPIKPMRRFPKWREAALATIGLAALGTMFFNGAWFYWIGVLGCAAAVEWYFRARIRCPQCQNSLFIRDVGLTENSKKIYYDCSECCVTWDPGVVIHTPDA